MNESQKAFIQEQIGYRFKNPYLLEQAFTRRSYSEENGGENNEVLEFIGDKALDLAVVRYLTEDYCFMNGEKSQFKSNLNESDLTELKRRLVERSALADRIDWLDLSVYLIMGEGDRKNRVDEKESVREDLFEAIFGAVALDCNWDSAKLLEVFQTMHEPESYLFDDDRENFVSLIQEWTLQKQGAVPYFYYDRETAKYGYSNMPRVNGEVIRCKESRDIYWVNAQQYYCLMKLGDLGTFFLGYGKSKSEARKSACKTAYEFLKKNNLWFSIKDEIEEPSESMAIKICSFSMNIPRVNSILSVVFFLKRILLVQVVLLQEKGNTSPANNPFCNAAAFLTNRMNGPLNTVSHRKCISFDF